MQVNNRLFEIVYILLQKKKTTAKELADRFEVSTRTIYRDIETLSTANIPIYASKGKDGGIGLLYAIAFTIKMSYKGTHKIDGYFEYVVPPLEGFWWQDGMKDSIDHNNKDQMNFISIIRLPDFVTKEDFNWAIKEATNKKKTDFSKVEFLSYDEGICVQCMHIGSYDDEPSTINLMHKYMIENGYELDITDNRFHHEIYLSDPRRCDVSKLKTVIRHPIRKKE